MKQFTRISKSAPSIAIFTTCYVTIGPTLKYIQQSNRINSIFMKVSMKVYFVKSFLFAQKFMYFSDHLACLDNVNI